MNTVTRIAQSFRCAGHGLARLVLTQRNFRIHLLAACLVAVLALWLGVSGGQLAALVIAVGLVLVSEAFNTAVEYTVDLASPQLQPLAKTAKDVSAAGVLLAALTALAVGLVVLGPRLLERLNR